MSGDIDERVVEMKFDNALFERNVQQTLKTLDGLEKGLQMKGATDGFSRLDGAAKRFSLAGIASGVQSLADKFSAFGVIGMSVINNLVGRVMEFGRSIAQNFFKPIQEGLSAYETKLDAVQTIQANTGASLDKVGGALKKLNDYANLTKYNFTEMAKNIGTFTAAGVDLKTSIASIKGIGNLAAMSGSSSAQAATAMYQLSQAISSGVVRLEDWNSVQTAGMGGKVFQNALMETARVHGVAVDAMVKKNGSFRNSLMEGWLTSDILTETLDKFTGDLTDKQLKSMGYTEKQIQKIQEQAKLANDAATKIKSFSALTEMLTSNNATAWAESWEIVTGNLKEAQDLYSGLGERIGGMMDASAAARNEQLKVWKELGGRDAIVKSLFNTFDAFMKVADTLGKAWSEVFPSNLGKNLAEISKWIEKFTEGLILSDDGAQMLHDGAKAVFTVIKGGTTILAGIGKVIWSTVGYFWKFASAVGEFIKPITTFIGSLFDFGGAADQAGSDIQGFFDGFVGVQESILNPLLAKIKELTDALDNFLNGGSMSADIRTKLQPIMDFFQSLHDYVVQNLGAAFTNLPGAISAAWGKITQVVSAVWNFAKKAAAAIGGSLSGMGEGIGNALKNLDFSYILNAFNAGILVALALAIRKVVKKFEEGSNILESLSGALDQLTDTLKTMQSAIKASIILQIAAAVALLAAALYLLSQVKPENLAAAVGAISVLFIALVKSMKPMVAMTDAASLKKLPLVGAALITMAGAVRILAGAVSLMAQQDPARMAGGVIAVIILLKAMVIVAQEMSKNVAGFMKAAGSLTVLATAMAILAGVVVIFAFIPFDKLVQGFAAMALLMSLVVGSAVILGKFGKDAQKAAVAMMAMAVAMATLAGVVIVFGLIPWQVVAKGLGFTFILLGMIVGAAVIVSKFAGQVTKAALGIAGMAFALQLLAGVVVVLGMLPLEVMAKGMFGLALLMVGLVAAANAMTGALPGAAAMIAVAGAVFILALALTMVGNMSLEQIITGLIGLAGVILIFAIASAALAPVLPAMFALAGVLALIGLAVGAFGAGIMMLALGAGMLGSILPVIAQAIIAFGTQLEAMGKGMLALAGVGAALIVFGAGAFVAGLGLAALGLGAAIAAGGLILLALASIIGVTGLAAFIQGVQQVFPMTGDLLALGGALLVLGAGMIVAGVGMILVGVGALLMAAGLTALQAAAANGTEAVGQVVKAFTDLWTQIPAMLAVGGALVVIGAGALALGLGMMLMGAGVFLTVAALASLFFISGMADSAVGKLMTTFDAFTSATPKLAASTADIVKLSTSLASLADYSGKAGDNLAKVTDGSSKIVSGMEGVKKAVTGAGEAMTTFSKDTTDVMDKTNKDVSNALITLGKSITKKVGGIAPDAKSAAKAVGKAIDAGFVQGMKDPSSMASVVAAAKEVAKKALAAAKNELDSHSPSRKFEQLGKDSDTGFAQGFTKNSKEVENASTSVGENAIAAMKNAMQSASDVLSASSTFDPVVKPVLDLSEVTKSASTIPDILGNQKMALQAATSTANAIQQDRSTQAADTNVADRSGNTYVSMEQNNYSPKSLTPAEVYRQTNNLVSKMKG